MNAYKVFMTQSNYIPWKGYFDAINEADCFVVYDHVQYTKEDWRNRNKIKRGNGSVWLTIPVNYHFSEKISQIHVADPHWAEKHWKTLSFVYKKAPYFKQYKPVFEQFYQSINTTSLSEINLMFIKKVCEILGIKTKIMLDTELDTSQPNRILKIISMCQQLGCTDFLIGPNAKSYIIESKFDEANIHLKWLDYSGYPEYHQLHPPFDHAVSILDLIFNEGSNATKFMKSFPRL